MTSREMQRRSAKARWSGKTAEARRREMSALAKAAGQKPSANPKRAARLPNNLDSNRPAQHQVERRERPLQSES